MRILLSLFCLCIADALMPQGQVRRSHLLKMSDSPFDDNPTGLTSGVIGPTGYFDPLGLAAGKDAATLRQYREAEIKHGRVCMLASVGLLSQVFTVLMPIPSSIFIPHHTRLTPS